MLPLQGEPSWRGQPAVCSIPGSHSPNLAAQAGVFTITLTAAARGRPQPVVALETVAETSWRSGTPLIEKYSRPREEAAALPELCEAYGVSGATMFPGPDGRFAPPSNDRQGLPPKGPGRRRCRPRTLSSLARAAALALQLSAVSAVIGGYLDRRFSRDSQPQATPSAPARRTSQRASEPWQRAYCAARGNLEWTLSQRYGVRSSAGRLRALLARELRFALE